MEDTNCNSTATSSASEKKSDAEICHSPGIVIVEQYVEGGDANASLREKPLSSLRKSLILFMLSGALFLDNYNACAVITALPTLGEDLGFTESSLQWVISGYTLTFAAFMLISGRLSDIFHPKPVFVVGFLIVGILSIPIAVSVNPIMVIIFRAIQGIGAAMNTPTAVAMVSLTFKDPVEKGRAFSIFGVVGAVGNVISFVLGGLLTAKLSWRWVFYLLAIIVIPFAISSWFVLPPHKIEHTEGRLRSIDWPGVSSLTAGLILFVFAISEGNSAGWKTAHVLVPLILSILLFAGFLAIEQSVKVPALPPRTWSNKNFTVLFFYAWSVNWTGFGAQLQFVELFMNLWGWSALSAALHCIPLGISAGVAAFLTGQLAPKVPRKILLVAGQVFMGIGAILYALTDSPLKYWSHMVPGMIIGMTGLAIAYVGCTVAMMEGARKGEEGVVGAMMYTSYQVGATLGLAIISSITIAVNDRLSEPTFDGYQASFWSLLGLNGIMIILTILFVRN